MNLETLAMPAKDTLRFKNPINIFFNKSKYYFILFSTIWY